MHEALVNALIRDCRDRVAAGERTDQPEEALMAVADDRAKLMRILGAIIEADERGQGIGYAEAMDAGRAELARLTRYP